MSIRTNAMTRVALLIVISALMSTAAAAQDNPNSPRARRDMIVSPPVKTKTPKWFEVMEPERWPTIGKPMNEPQWGTLGKCGWTGVTNTKPLGC